MKKDGVYRKHDALSITCMGLPPSALGLPVDEILSRSVQAKAMAGHMDITLKNAEISG